MWLFAGEHSGGGSLRSAKMQQRGVKLRRGREAAPDLWPQQARGEEGEQVPQVPGLHVEPALVGHGDGRNHGHRLG